MQEKLILEQSKQETLPSPLSLAEVPQFVRDVVNTLYPLTVNEIGMQLVGVKEIDTLFFMCTEPLQQVCSGPRDARAQRAGVVTCKVGVKRASAKCPDLRRVAAHVCALVHTH